MMIVTQSKTRILILRRQDHGWTDGRALYVDDEPPYEPIDGRSDEDDESEQLEMLLKPLYW